jgi:hypothetical protein
MRELLDAIKRLVDDIYQKQPAYWSGAKQMVLYPPASELDIEKFFRSPVSERLPRSYADFLRASNGLDTGWRRLCFLGTDEARQGVILEWYRDASQRLEGSFKYAVGEVTEESIAQWESNPRQLFVARHPVLAASGQRDLLVGDIKTQQADGEMELCWWTLDARVKKRYPNIRMYFEETLKEVEQYHSENIANKRRGKKRDGRK